MQNRLKLFEKNVIRSIFGENFTISKFKFADSLCGLVVRVPGYRSRYLGSIQGATGFSENGTGSIQPREYD
jgi:hypothetical protein